MYVLTNSVNFCAGKVHVYSDFDGTYCPASHESLHNPNSNPEMPAYCKRMEKFLDSNNEKVQFHVTTGRTFGEYKAVSELLRTRGYELPLPKSFIAKNGSDEYVKSRDAFYQGGEFPFDYKNPQKLKQERVTQETNWNGQKIKEYIKNLAEKYRLKLIEADTRNSSRDYGSNTMSGKITAGVLGSRNDGDLKVNLIFGEENRKFIQDVENFLKKDNVKYDLAKRDLVYTITPEFQGGSLTKLYDTKLALKEAEKNRDIVIVAGNGANDFAMLNPLEYLDKDFIKECEVKSSHKEFYKNKDSMLKGLIEINDGSNKALKKELESNGFLKELKNLPLYSIIIKEDPKLDKLLKAFEPTGKVIEVPSGKLDEGIKKIIKKQKIKSVKSKMVYALPLLLAAVSIPAWRYYKSHSTANS